MKRLDDSATEKVLLRDYLLRIFFDELVQQIFHAHLEGQFSQVSDPFFFGDGFFKFDNAIQKAGSKKHLILIFSSRSKSPSWLVFLMQIGFYFVICIFFLVSFNDREHFINDPLFPSDVFIHVFGHSFLLLKNKSSFIFARLQQ